MMEMQEMPQSGGVTEELMMTSPRKTLTRRTLLQWVAAGPAGLMAVESCTPRKQEAPEVGGPDYVAVANRCREFIRSCARDDGGYDPSPDPQYRGNSDTSASDLAAVTYAATLAKTLGWRLPEEEKSIAFVQDHQQPEGFFVNLAGNFDPADPLARLYNTTQGVVALRALGASPRFSCSGVMDPFFADGVFEGLPLYTTSFFPLFYAALGEAFPEDYRDAIAEFMKRQQDQDGYLQDHVAATFHMAHFFRMIGEPTPRADAMVARTLKQQTEQGGWNIKEPDWDVHACFDAVFILRQLGGDSEECRRAIDRAALWAAACQNPDGGFGHFQGWHSDMDAVYFQLGTLIQAEKIPEARFDLPDGHTLSWGHAMNPKREYGIEG